MASFARQVEGKIYHTKFDDLDCWTEEEDLRNESGLWARWGDPSYTALLSNPAYSPSFSLDARIEATDTASGNLPSGRYLRRFRSVTIPSGLLSVRMQVRHRWTRNLSTMAMARKITLGSQTFLNQQASDAQDTWHFKNDAVSTSSGSQTLKVGVESYATVYPLDNNVQQHYFDDLVIARSGSILVKGLPMGWKAKLYDASDQLIAQATESGGTAALDVSSQAYPITGRFMITDASDVVQYTSVLSDDIFGGDEYQYTSIGSVLTVSTDNYIINKSGESSPTSATITFTLKDSSGSPLNGKPLNFSTTLGSLSPTSANTNASGEASTTLTSSVKGVAIVTAEFPGDSSYSATICTVEISVHGGADGPDAAMDYDVWVQGERLENCVNIKISSNGAVLVASVESPDSAGICEGGYDLTIYRKGTRIFFGKIEVISRKIAPDLLVAVQGRDYSASLRDIPISSASYTNSSLKSIIESIHSLYVNPLKQVTLGTVAAFLDNIIITLSVTDVTAYDLLLMAASLGGASLYVDADRALNVR